VIEAGAFHFVTVGTTPELIRNLWDPVASGSAFRFSHIMHPGFSRESLAEMNSTSEKYFFVESSRVRLPPPDRELLLSLERNGVPTVHNMILGDRVVSALPYGEVLGYATLLARRLAELFGQIRPAAVIGGFDGIHGGLALAVAKKMGIPWYALHFSVIPEGFACFCDRASPAARVFLKSASFGRAEALAAKSLQQFESKAIVAPAYIAPTAHTVSEHLARMLGRLSTLSRMMRRGPARGLSRYTEPRGKRSVAFAFQHLRHAAGARRAVARQALVAKPPPTPYVLFGLHMQPESSIDVWAPFFSNQMWVVELLSRSIPPSHKLLVKIHKSDTARYSGRELQKMAAYPGVELVAPLADTRRFIENSQLIVLIQGTMGLEAALIGRPVIMLGQSPFTVFPSVTQIGDITELPALVTKKLVEERPSRGSILKAYAEYLRPFAPASTNDWAMKKETTEIADFRRLFDCLREHTVANSTVPAEPAGASI
jgi:hypothetical protein